jgi:hypothetical protein
MGQMEKDGNTGELVKEVKRELGSAEERKQLTGTGWSRPGQGKMKIRERLARKHSQVQWNMELPPPCW